MIHEEKSWKLIGGAQTFSYHCIMAEKPAICAVISECPIDPFLYLVFPQCCRHWICV